MKVEFIKGDGSVVRLRASVEIVTPDLSIRAEEVDYDPNTGSADARGNVTVRLTRRQQQSPSK